MKRDTTIQLAAAGLLAVAATASGMLMPRMIDNSERHALKYTDVTVEGAPPIVAIGTAIGALRGLIVDFLWIKVQVMKDRGQLFEVMADSELITKLQPRFAAVWGFHGHNMAYNVSVATQTEQQRWEWVQAGIRLVRNEGLRYNPNDVELHKEIAFWFAHKIEGYSDDAHLYYKYKLCEEWHKLLGEPPAAWDDRTAWIKKVADAAPTLAEAEKRTPGVRDLVERLKADFGAFSARTDFKLDFEFLQRYQEWVNLTQLSFIAREMEGRQNKISNDERFRTFDDIAGDPALQEQWDTLIAHVRKRVLLDEYNMSPQKMYEYTRDLGPIDWRSGHAHALYFARLGSERGDRRGNWEDNIYRVLNNDRLQIQAMQGLAKRGRIYFDPYGGELPARMAEPVWVDTIFGEFNRLYAKHFKTRGAGGESFINFLKNFMAASVRENFREGKKDRADMILKRLDELFGMETDWKNPEFRRPLEAFVMDEIRGEYNHQPELAPSDAVAALKNGIRNGIGKQDDQLWEESKAFVQRAVDLFRNNESYGFQNKFGRQRIGDLIAQIEDALPLAFAQIMTDPEVSWEEKMTLWRRIDDYEPLVRAMIYNQVAPQLEQRYIRTPYAQKYPFAQRFPAPSMQQFEQARAVMEQRLRERQAAAGSPEISRTDIGTNNN